MIETPLNIKRMPPVWLVAVLSFVRNGLMRLTRRLMPANVVVLEMVQHFFISKAIGMASDLNLADHLLNSPKTAGELAALTNTNPEALYRMMRTLTQHGVFKESKDGLFSNNNISLALINQEGSMKFMASHQVNPNNWKMIGEMDYVIRTGQSANQRVLGMEVFEYLGQDPAANELYNKALTNTSNLISSAILSVTNFKDSKQLVDLGGGQGYLLASILKKNKKLKGVLFDLPHVVKGAEEIIAKLNLQERMTIYPGSFFEAIPVSDSYFMKNIIHAFDDETCIKLLSNIFKAAEPNARVYIVEPVIGTLNGSTFGTLFDLQLMVGISGGRERTIDEYKNMLSKSGFKLNKIISTVSPFSIIEAIKQQ